MNKLLDFLENYSVDKNFYTVICDLYGREEWEVYWNKHQTKSKWGLKRTSDKKWSYHNRGELVDRVSAQKLNVEQLEFELLNSIKTMVAYTFMVQDEAAKQFGQHFLVDTRKEFADFASALIEAINRILPTSEPSTASTEKKPLLQVVRQ